MKKLISIIALLTVTTPAFAAANTARPSHLTRTSDGGYDVTYNYADKAKTGWYASLRAELSLLNWENKYYVEGEYLGHDKYSFEPIFTANFAFGKHLGYFWRGELEAGYISKFTDEDEGFKFKLSVPYIMANGYYDFTNGLYVGAGFGVAVPMTELADDAFISGKGKKQSVSPMGALMAGYAYKLDDNLVLDLRYRLGGFWGTKHERQWTENVDPAELANLHLKNEIGFILDNSISVGIRYEF